MTRFLDLIETARSAEAASSAFDENELLPARGVAEAESAAIPHVTTVAAFECIGDKARRWSTASEIDVVRARSWLKLSQGEDPVNFPDDVMAVISELVTAADDRDAKVAQVRLKWRLEELIARSNELATAASDATYAVLQRPVTEMSELRLKLDYAREVGVKFDDFENEIYADVRRLTGAEA